MKKRRLRRGGEPQVNRYSICSVTVIRRCAFERKEMTVMRCLEERLEMLIAT